MAQIQREQGPPRPSDEPEPIRAVLRDGSEIVVRRLSAEDAPDVEAGFARLSEESRRLRFLTSKPRLSASELRYLTEVDGHRHEALGAIDPRTGDGVGIARFVKDAEDPHSADVAVTVVDEWQGRGVGSLLLSALSDRARTEGITSFTALVAADNESMNRLLARLDPPVHRIRPIGEAAEYKIELAHKGMGARLHDALRAAAAGDWRLPEGVWQELRSLVPIRLRRQ